MSSTEKMIQHAAKSQTNSNPFIFISISSCQMHPQLHQSLQHTPYEKWFKKTYREENWMTRQKEGVIAWKKLHSKWREIQSQIDRKRQKDVTNKILWKRNHSANKNVKWVQEESVSHTVSPTFFQHSPLLYFIYTSLAVMFAPFFKRISTTFPFPFSAAQCNGV